MAKKYLDNVGLDHAWDKIKTYLTNKYAAKIHTHTVSQITDLDTKINVSLIEKRVVTTSGAVSIPTGTRIIVYASIGGGGGGGGGTDLLAGGGGGGSGSAAGGSGGNGGTASVPGFDEHFGGNGGKGGDGEAGFLYNFAGLSISAVIGAGGSGGNHGDKASVGDGKAGGKSYVNVSGSSNAFVLIVADRVSVRTNGRAGNANNSSTGGAGGTALTVLGTTAGAGGRGGNKKESGSAGGKGAIIFFFYG